MSTFKLAAQSPSSGSRGAASKASPRAASPGLEVQTAGQSFAFVRLSRAFSSERAPDIRKRLRSIARLKSKELARSLVDLAGELGIVTNELEAEHFLSDWFQNWFPDQPVAELFRDALSLAVELALEGGARLPIEAYRVGGASADVRFAVVRSKHQVTVLLITPLPATLRKVKVLEEKQSVWVVRNQGKRTKIEQQRFDSLQPVLPGRAKAVKKRASKKRSR